MNFDFLKECRMESPRLQEMYEDIFKDLETAEWKYWEEPQECGIILRGTAEKICRVYNIYYEVGCPKAASLEEFLCYTDQDEHNAMVSRFLSAVRGEQRDRLNKLRVLGNDCILGREGPDLGMTFEDRMSQNARHMMETMMETIKEMCGQINKRDDVCDKTFSEDALPESRKDRLAEMGQEGSKEKKKSLLGRIFRNRR